jgi:integrase
MGELFAAAQRKDPAKVRSHIPGSGPACSFGSLRWGELAALRRCDIDLDARTVNVARQLTDISGHLAFGPPKSDAGKRIIVVPALIIPDLRWHLSCFAQPGYDGLVFTSPTGIPLRHGHFRSRVWAKALGQAGFPPLHFHDLRHARNMLTAATGATLRELMDRMGTPPPGPR